MPFDEFSKYIQDKVNAFRSLRYEGVPDSVKVKISSDFNACVKLINDNNPDIRSYCAYVLSCLGIHKQASKKLLIQQFYVEDIDTVKIEILKYIASLVDYSQDREFIGILCATILDKSSSVALRNFAYIILKAVMKLYDNAPQFAVVGEGALDIDWGFVNSIAQRFNITS